MNKGFTKLISSLLILFSGAFAMNVYASPADILHVDENRRLAKPDGTEVVLRGVNFGGWLLQETWMCPVVAFDGSRTVKNGTETGWANADTLDSLDKLVAKGVFTRAEADNLVRSYIDNYITEWDFQNVKNLGFNCVRIPFWYRNFMNEDGTYLDANDDNIIGFQKLDWACDMADKYGLYLILDMHGCPGGQSGDHSTGKTGRNLLYKNEVYRAQMENLWVKIASRYKNESCIAAYDIMNEPMNNSTASHGVAAENVYYTGSQAAVSATNEIYKRMVSAIRKADPNHIITVQGVWRIGYLPNPETMGEDWTNIMYQGYYYDSGSSFLKKAWGMDFYRRLYGNAVYIGEFNPGVYRANGFKGKLDSYDISYTLWNYKTYTIAGGIEGWGLYNRNMVEGFDNSNYFGTLPKTDLYKVCDGNVSLTNKMLSSWDSASAAFTFEKAGLTDSEIKTFYTNLWTGTYLSTQGFTFNEELMSFFR